MCECLCASGETDKDISQSLHFPIRWSTSSWTPLLFLQTCWHSAAWSCDPDLIFPLLVMWCGRHKACSSVPPDWFIKTHLKLWCICLWCYIQSQQTQCVGWRWFLLFFVVVSFGLRFTSKITGSEIFNCGDEKLHFYSPWQVPWNHHKLFFGFCFVVAGT